MTQPVQQLESWLKKRGGWNGTKKSTKVSLFSLPLDCIPCLKQRHDADEDQSGPQVHKSTGVVDAVVSASRGLTCIACQLTFNEVREQQLHFKSDLHLVNLKRRVQGLTALLSSDAASSDSVDINKDAPAEEDEDSDSNEERDTDFANETNNEVFQPSGFTNALGSITKEFSSQRGPTLRIKDASLPNWELVVSTGMFATDSAFHTREWNTNDEAMPSPWDQLSLQVERIRQNKICAVFLLRSGRFAGAIFDGQNLLIHKVR